jgi:exodeoxyribonuclease VII small subunit
MDTMSETERIPFEEALGRLEMIVSRLQDGSVSLEEAIALYEEGRRLSSYCATLLEEAELKIETVNAS